MFLVLITQHKPYWLLSESVFITSNLWFYCQALRLGIEAKTYCALWNTLERLLHGVKLRYVKYIYLDNMDACKLIPLKCVLPVYRILWHIMTIHLCNILKEGLLFLKLWQIHLYVMNTKADEKLFITKG